MTRHALADAARVSVRHVQAVCWRFWQPSRQMTNRSTLTGIGLMALAMLTIPLWSWSVPHSSELWGFAALGGFSVLSHLLSITALRHAEASLLAPLVYLELLGATLLGYFVFDEVPGAHVWAGAGAIIAGGVLLLAREAAPGSRSE